MCCLSPRDCSNQAEESPGFDFIIFMSHSPQLPCQYQSIVLFSKIIEHSFPSQVDRHSASILVEPQPREMRTVEIHGVVRRGIYKHQQKEEEIQQMLFPEPIRTLRSSNHEIIEAQPNSSSSAMVNAHAIAMAGTSPWGHLLNRSRSYTTLYNAPEALETLTQFKNIFE